MLPCSHYRRTLLILGLWLWLGACSVPMPAAPAAGAPPLPAAPANAPAAVPQGALAQLEQLHATAAPVLPAPDDAVFGAGTSVAGLDLGGMNVPTARAHLIALETRLQRPLEMVIDTNQVTLFPADIGLQLPIEELLNEALAQQAQGQSARIPVRITYDVERLRQIIQGIADETMIPPTLRLITATDSISRSFGYDPGQRINVEVALYQIEQQLTAPLGTRRVTLSRSPDPTLPPPRATPQQIQEQLTLMAQEWEGVLGFYLHELDTDTVVALNERTVFSGASVMKVPIMMHAHMTLKGLTSEQSGWLNAMILDSDNLSANNLLAASVGGAGTEDALLGLEAMNENLRRLGLEHTYQRMPYESYDYLVGILGMDVLFGPEFEGEPPYTMADPVIRTTPAEMGHLFVLMDRCMRGDGDLLTMFPDTITPARCASMLDLLTKNHDLTRMVAGMPPGVRVEHKSGWVDQMQCDVGIVRSPAGDYVLALYLFHDEYYADSSIADPFLAHLSRMVYTAYNPVHL